MEERTGAPAYYSKVEVSGAMSKPITHRPHDTPALRCTLCGKPMEVIAKRAAGRKVLRTFSCAYCGNIDTIAYNRDEPFRDDAA